VTAKPTSAATASRNFTSTGVKSCRVLATRTITPHVASAAGMGSATSVRRPAWMSAARAPGSRLVAAVRSTTDIRPNRTASASRLCSTECTRTRTSSPGVAPRCATIVSAPAV
jgi:hypothetical protein